MAGEMGYTISPLGRSGVVAPGGPALFVPVIGGDQGGPNFGRFGHKLAVGETRPVGDPDKPEKLSLPFLYCPAAGARRHWRELLEMPWARWWQI